MKIMFSKIKIRKILRISRFKRFKVSLVLFIVLSLILGTFDYALAYRLVYKSSISTEPSKITFIGQQQGEQFGASLASGDINGDGIDDLIVGSPFYSSEGMIWNGKVSVFYGATSFPKNTYDLKEDQPDLIVYGRSSGDQLGISVASGDFNNDEYDDFLMGAYNAASDYERPGKAFLIFGRKRFENTVWYLSKMSANKELVGGKDKGGFGVSVYMADINHDHIDDILIGAPFSLSTDGVKTGNVYVYFGSDSDDSGDNSVDSYAKLFGNSGADVIFEGHSAGERFGSAIKVGDVIGGNYPDIVISAYFADGPNGVQSGKVYLYKGYRKYKKMIRSADDVLSGDSPYAWLGFSIDVGKVGENIADSLLVSSFPYTNRSKRGNVYLLHGRGSFTENLLSPDQAKSPFIVNNESADYAFEGGRGENYLGASILFQDLNGDSQNDFVLGAPGIGFPKSEDSGEIYLYYSTMLWDKVPFKVSEDDFSSYVVGGNPDDWFGAKMAKLNFNSDEYGDTAVSSRYADRFNEKGEISDSNNGEVYVLLGHKNPFGEMMPKKEPQDEFITRGDFISTVIDKFSIKEERKEFINDCYLYREFCFFAFSGVSDYSGIKLEPNIILYPDVSYGSKYYEPVTIATMLGALHGYASEKDSPFKPEAFITRIQALKVILSINQLVEPMLKFELANKLGGADALEKQKSYFKDIKLSVQAAWWYPRFANYAYENNLVDDKKYFRPDDYLTKGEFKIMMERTLTVVNSLKSNEEGN